MKKVASLIAMMIAFTFCLRANAEVVELPEDVDQMCEEASEEFDICPSILKALVYQESRGILDNASQITYTGWFKEGFTYTGNNEKHDKRNSIRVCAYYLKKWNKEYRDINISLTGWNMGIENSLAREGRSVYATSVLKYAEIFERSQR